MVDGGATFQPQAGAFEPYQKGRKSVIKFSSSARKPVVPQPVAQTHNEIHYMKRTLENGEEVLMMAVDKNAVKALMLNGFKNRFPKPGEPDCLETNESNLKHVIVAPTAMRPIELLLLKKADTLFFHPKHLLGLYVDVKRFITPNTVREEKLYIWPPLATPEGHLDQIREFDRQLPFLPLHIPLPQIPLSIHRILGLVTRFDQAFLNMTLNDDNLKSELGIYWPGNLHYQRDVLFHVRIDGPLHLALCNRGDPLRKYSQQEREHKQYCVLCFFAVTRGLSNPHEFSQKREYEYDKKRRFWGIFQ